MIPAKVIKFLDATKTKYETLGHKTVFTAHDKAATLKAPEKQIGKTLVVKLDNQLALVLIPANRNLDKKKVIKVAKAKKMDFVTERLIKGKIKGAKVGAVPPFGALWKIPTFADRNFLKNSKIIVSSGDYNYSFKMTPAHYKKAVPDAIVGDLGKAK